MLDILNRLDIRTEVREMDYFDYSPTYKVYCLKDPRNFEIRYYGMTQSDIRKRYSEHFSETYKVNKQKRAWLDELLNLNLRPIMEVLSEHKDKKLALTEEQNLIKTGLLSGLKLLNKEARKL